MTRTCKGLALSSLAWVAYPLTKLPALLGEQEIDGLELAVRGPETWPGHVCPEQLRVSQSYCQEMLGHLQHPALPRMVSVSLDVSGNSTRERSLAWLEATCAFSQDLGCQEITVLLRRPDRIDARAWLNQALEIALRYQQHLAIETHAGTWLANPAQALQWCHEANCVLCLDQAHFRMLGLDPEAWHGLYPYLRSAQLRWSDHHQGQLPYEETPQLSQLLQGLPAQLPGYMVVEYVGGINSAADAQSQASALRLYRDLQQFVQLGQLQISP